MGRPWQIKTLKAAHGREEEIDTMGIGEAYYKSSAFGITDSKGSKPWTEEDKAGRYYRKLSPEVSAKHTKGKQLGNKQE